MKKEMTEEMFEKASKLKDDLGELLHNSELELGLVLPVLIAITCEAAILQAEMRPHEFIASITRGVCAMVEAAERASEEDEEDDEPTDGRNNLQWLH